MAVLILLVCLGASCRTVDPGLDPVPLMQCLTAT